MPPKNGKRESAGGKLPAALHAKEQQSVTIEDLLFPRSTIVHLAKDSSVQGVDANTTDAESKKVILSKDAATALQRSATVFVNHLMMYAREGAAFQNRKSVNVDDVLAALDQCGLEGLKTLVRSRLDEYQKALELRKKEKIETKEHEDGPTESGDEGVETQPDTELAVGEPAKKPKLDN
ncbi:LANO_0C06678g1_1 [Lachancea nothofagi CBS 11611]|uniref:DNA polymerase epsilon subunit D n=1 Tax=Lachancea nothofagi CBS 11611 TaxID=1266666 RepID=A0A1G4J8E7_9SACH|nr:LANO_0C06678g1_1 [Lachancea nothofagi CBS 11611]